MKFAAFVFGFVLSANLFPLVSAQQLAPALKVQQTSPWWAAVEMGAGQITLNSDLNKGSANTKFAIGFAGGYQPSDWLRVGAHLNGWTIQAGDLYDPSKGVGVSNLGGIIDVMPSRRYRLFARGGFGLSMFSCNNPVCINGSGPGWETGGGYEIPIRGRIGLAPMVEYATGRLNGGSPTSFTPESGLRYSVLEFKLSLVGNFGHRRR